MKLHRILGLGAVMAVLPSAGWAQDAATYADAAETAYIFNTLLFLIGGFLVMWMAAGFAMLEAGFVRSKNVSMQCLKNIALYSIAGLMFWVIGYNVMYSGVADHGGLIGTFSPADVTTGDIDTGYSNASDWFFQMVFCATTASIVSGTVAERMKLLPFLIFVVFLTGIIYPVVGAWEWGGGLLNGEFVTGIGGAEFSDFAGSTLVHSTGGWAALVGAILLGARAGKYGSDGSVHPIPASNIPLATLGMFILWLGWFGFNGGSQLAMGTLDDATAVGVIFINTNLAAAAGVIVAMLITGIRYKKVDVTMAINGALAGLVAITAEPLTPSVPMAILIGAIGSALAVFTVPLLDKLKIDDVVGAIPVHLVAGIWGTLAVPLTNEGASFVTQLIGVIAVGIFVCIASAIVWLALKYTLGIRVSAEEEMDGLDVSEIGVAAYPEFTPGS